jgi:hypothetical protein
MAVLLIVTANRLNGRMGDNPLILLLLRCKFYPPFIPTVVIVDLNELFGKFPICLLDDFFTDLVPKDPWEYVGPYEPVEETKAEQRDARDPRYPVGEGERLCAFNGRHPWHYLGKPSIPLTLVERTKHTKTNKLIRMLNEIAIFQATYSGRGSPAFARRRRMKITPTTSAKSNKRLGYVWIETIRLNASPAANPRISRFQLSGVEVTNEVQ